MGKKVYNAKARQNPETIVDNSSLKNVSLLIFKNESKVECNFTFFCYDNR